MLNWHEELKAKIPVPRRWPTFYRWIFLRVSLHGHKTGRSFIRARHSLNRGSTHAVPLRRDREMDQRRVAHVEGALEKLEGLVEISHLGVATGSPN